MLPPPDSSPKSSDHHVSDAEIWWLESWEDEREWMNGCNEAIPPFLLFISKFPEPFNHFQDPNQQRVAFIPLFLLRAPFFFSSRVSWVSLIKSVFYYPTWINPPSARYFLRTSSWWSCRGWNCHGCSLTASWWLLLKSIYHLFRSWINIMWMTMLLTYSWLAFVPKIINGFLLVVFLQLDVWLT